MAAPCWALAIDKYCYISVRRLPPFFEHRSRIAYSRIEMVRDVSEIQHPAVRGVLNYLNISDGLEIHHDADLPARSGMGSSSSFTVGLLNALNALDSRMTQKRELAAKAIFIEQEVLKEKVGCQDQIWAAYGGLNKIDFFPDGNFAVNPMILSRDRLAEFVRSIMLVFTGFSRFSSDFAENQLSNLGNRKPQLRAMRAMVETASRHPCGPAHAAA